MSAQSYYLMPGDPRRPAILANAHAFLDRLPENKPWKVTTEKFVKPRSEQQRKALFAAAYKPIMEFMGLRGEQDKKDLHAFWCGEYFGWHPDLRNKPLRTTTKNECGERDEITIAGALEFYAFIQQRAAERGIDVPDPDPFWRERMERAA